MQKNCHSLWTKISHAIPRLGFVLEVFFPTGRAHLKIQNCWYWWGSSWVTLSEKCPTGFQEPSAHNFFQDRGKRKNIKPTKRAISENAKYFSLLESWHMVSYHNVQYYLQKTITELPIIWKVSHYISFKLLQNEIQV